jgi:F420H(2)-dependent quinone reductase
MALRRDARDEVKKPSPAWLPPRWVIRFAWAVHRAIYRLTRGHAGLWRPKRNGWGAARLTTIGRRTGAERSVMIGYFEDGPDLVTMAMNGWGEGEPAWWLNLQAQPDARVEHPDGPRLVTARAALDGERERLWARWREIDKNLDAYAARRSTETAVVILAPRLERERLASADHAAPSHRDRAKVPGLSRSEA